MNADVPLNRAPVSEAFKRSMAELSRRLGERTALESASVASAETRRAALQAYDRARLRWTVMMALGVLAAIATGIGLASLLPDESEPSPPAATASAAPVAIPIAAPIEAPTPPLTAKLPESPMTAPPVAAAPEPPAQSQSATSEPAADANALRLDEVKELQAKLRAFGFSPGPIDGVAGPMTQNAAERYRQARGQPQTTEVDRQLLEQLRQDPAPSVAQRAVPQHPPRPDARPTGAPPPRRAPDPFERVGRWLESVLR
jgi:peptidoglycan hydrolase-like protein with peptidoglycan-binding domain